MNDWSLRAAAIAAVAACGPSAHDDMMNADCSEWVEGRYQVVWDADQQPRSDVRLEVFSGGRAFVVEVRDCTESNRLWTELDWQTVEGAADGQSARFINSPDHDPAIAAPWSPLQEFTVQRGTITELEGEWRSAEGRTGWLGLTRINHCVMPSNDRSDACIAYQCYYGPQGGECD